MPDKSPAAKPLTPTQVKKRLSTAKRGQIILWPYQGDVEEGTVLFVTTSGVDVCWLRGHSSSNDTVPFHEVLALHDKTGPEMEIFPWRGKGFITQAGAKWIAANPRK